MPRPPPPNAALTIRGKPISRGDFGGLSGVGDGLFGAGDDGDSGLLRQLAGGGLVAEQFEQFGAGADEGDAGALAGAGQGRIFGEEAVARDGWRRRPFRAARATMPSTSR